METHSLASIAQSNTSVSRNKQKYSNGIKEEKGLINNHFDSDTKDTFDLDDFFFKIGDFGRYQYFQYFLCCTINLVLGAVVFELIFIAATPSFICADGTEEDNETYNGVDRFANYSKNSPQCFVRPSEPADSNATVSCTNFTYSHQVYGRTIVEEWNLVCGRRALLTLSKSLFFAGRFIGALICGMLADKFGRRMAMLGFVILYLVGGLLMAFSPTVEVFASATLLRGMAHVGLYNSTFVLCAEIVTPSKRKVAGVVPNQVYVGGHFVVIGLSYFVRNWRHIILILTSPVVLFFIIFFILQESPRWLISQGRIEEAIVILRRAAKCNGVPIPDSTFDCLRKQQARKVDMSEAAVEIVETEDGETEVRPVKPHGKHVFSMLCETWYMAAVTITMLLSSFSSSITYYGLAFNLENLKGSPYVIFTFFAITIAASYVVCYLTLDRIGRKPVTVTSMIAGGLVCIVCPFIPAEQHWVQIGASIMGQLLISVAYGVVILYAVEVFPTSIRNIGFSTISMAARIAGALAPPVLELRSVFPPLPHLSFGLLVLSCGCLTIILPETKGQPLPETPQDLRRAAKAKREAV